MKQFTLVTTLLLLLVAAFEQQLDIARAAEPEAATIQ